VYLPADPRSAAVARTFVAVHCRMWHLDRLRDDAVLVVSELVGNAVSHARTAAGLRLERLNGGIRIEVSDTGRWNITPALTDPLAEHGRGLLLMDRLATTHGVDQRPDGKTVWAELREVATPGDGSPVRPVAAA
jgi:anti-sigma regulatory factor (Ser/Thr protein kinase)